jgi:hypothetical protein
MTDRFDKSIGAPGVGEQAGVWIYFLLIENKKGRKSDLTPEIALEH